MQGIVDKGFQLHFGYTIETEKLWPGTDEIELILKKIELLAPGLTQEDDGSGELVPAKIQKSLEYKVFNQNSRRRDTLHGQQTSKIYFFPFLHLTKMMRALPVFIEQSMCSVKSGVGMATKGNLHQLTLILGTRKKRKALC